MSELLAPAGGMEALTAAVQNGADAVYFGARLFNARRGADNFGEDGLKEAVSYCHARGVRAHVTLNTLVRDGEMAALEAQICEIAEAGADAVIVQDLGVAALVRQMARGFLCTPARRWPYTTGRAWNTCATTALTARCWRGRCRIAEIEQCAGLGVNWKPSATGRCACAAPGNAVFQPRGRAQRQPRACARSPAACPIAWARRAATCSPRATSCCWMTYRPWSGAGSCSFKIEGRLKRPEYVAVVTSVYRRALDGKPISAEDREALLQIFNRGGLQRGYLRDMNDAELMCPERPNHMGALVGTLGVLRRDVDAEDALAERRGDAERPVKLQGRAGARVSVRGDIYRLVDAAQMRAARESYAHERRLTHLTAQLTLRVGEPMRLRVSDGKHVFEAVGEETQAARNKPLDTSRVREQLQKTGGTVYVLDAIDLDADETAFAAASQLNALRRAALEGMTAARVSAFAPEKSVYAAEPLPAPRPEAAKTRLIARSDRPEILLAAREAGADELALDPCDWRREALDACLAALGGERFSLVLPAVANADVLDGVHAWARAHRERLTAVYAANVAHLGMDWGVEMRGDFALNLFNSRAVDEAGLARYMPSLELTVRQMADMPGEKELLIWGRAPLMRLRHCPLRAAHKLPGPHDACRRCDRAGEPIDGMALIDRRGAAFPLRRVASDGGCVVEALNSVPHWLLPKFERLCACSGWVLMLRAGEPVQEIVSACRAALDGKDADLAPLAGMQTTTGHDFRGVE